MSRIGFWVSKLLLLLCFLYCKMTASIAKMSGFLVLTVKKQCKRHIPWQWMKEHNYAFQSRTQNICFVIPISAVILKRTVKITSIFGSYRFLRIALHFLTFTSPSSKLEFVYPPCGGVEQQMLIFSSGFNNTLTSQKLLNGNPIPKLTIVLIWKTPACLKIW